MTDNRFERMDSSDRRTRRNREFVNFLLQVAQPRAGTMGEGEQAACLWWASLSPTERQLVHAESEKHLLGDKKQ